MADKMENGSTSVLQIMSNLTFGELAQYSVGGAAEGAINEKDYPRVMAAVNRGVNQIQQDLSLNENAVRLKLIEGILTYPIHSKYSLVTGTETHKFVDDSVYAPFEDDILRIQIVYDKEGRELPINNRNRVDSIFVPQHNVIQHPFVQDGDILGVVYTRFTRPAQVTTAEEASTTYLAIPDYTLNALYAYVASIMSAGITTQQEISDTQVWRQEYERLIAKMKNTPAIPENDTVNTKLTDKGFI